MASCFLEEEDEEVVDELVHTPNEEEDVKHFNIIKKEEYDYRWMDSPMLMHPLRTLHLFFSPLEIIDTNSV